MADNERGQALAAYWAAVWGDDVNGEEARRAWGSHKHAFDAAWDKQQERLRALEQELEKTRESLLNYTGGR